MDVLRVLRPVHWVKNTFVFAALVFSRHLIGPWERVLPTVARVFGAFVCFCLAASAMYIVNGPDFKAVVPLPVSARAAGQYPIGNAEHWRQIVANLAVIVDELDRTFLPELEQAVGRAPEWFEPAR